MDKSTRIKLLVVALACIALGSAATFAFASRNSFPDNAEGPKLFLSSIFSKSEKSWVILDSTTDKIITSITTPNMPGKFYYHVVCDGFAHISKDDTAIGIWTNADSTAIDWNTIRFYKRVEYTGIHTERVYHLGPGPHTFYFVGDRYWGTGEGRINYYTITVTAFTDGQNIVTGGTAEPGVDPTGSK